MGTRFDPNHPARPRDVTVFEQAYRDLGDEAPWLLAWKDGAVVINPETGRYMYSSEVPNLYRSDRRGRGGRR